MIELLERFVQATCRTQGIDPGDLVEDVLDRSDLPFTTAEAEALRQMATRVRRNLPDDLSDSQFSAFGGLPRER